MTARATRPPKSSTPFAKDHPEVRLLQNPGNHGKGYSVRNGILHSFGEVVMFTDADLSAPIEEADGLFAAIAAGADIAIGSRWLERTRQTIRQPLYRQFFGRCFNGVTRAVMGLPYADTQCGFKAFTRAAAQTVFQLQTIERWGFDPEILFIARKRGYRVDEVAVSWAHDERTRISYLKDGTRMLQDIAIVRWNALLGRYNKAGRADLTAPGWSSNAAGFCASGTRCRDADAIFCIQDGCFVKSCRINGKCSNPRCRKGAKCWLGSDRWPPGCSPGISRFFETN